MAETESSVPVQRLFGRLDYRHQHGDEDQRKATSELHMIVSPQNSAENVTANRLSVHMMIDACEAGT